MSDVQNGNNNNGGNNNGGNNAGGNNNGGNNAGGNNNGGNNNGGNNAGGNNNGGNNNGGNNNGGNNNGGNNNGGNNNGGNNNNANAISNTASPTISLASGARSGSVSGSVGGASASASNSTSISIPATAAAGGVTMLQPQSTATTFYKIGPSESITFKWNLTSLYVTPTSLTVRAYCSDLNAEFPVGPLPTGNNPNYTNAGIFPGNTTQVVWNPYEWQGKPGIPGLAAATYALRIYDERGSNAPANKGGYLSPYMDKLKFAMYFPQSYVPYEDWTCATCSGRMSLDSPSTLPVLMSLLIMIITAWGLLRR